MNEIQFTIGIGLKAPIAEGPYKVGAYDIEVSYPEIVNLGMGLEPSPRWTVDSVGGEVDRRPQPRR